MRLLRVLTVAAAAVTLTALVSAGSAQAQTKNTVHSKATTTTTTVAYGLSITAFDPKVAKAHGYTVAQNGNDVTLTKNGVSKSYSIGAGASPKTVTPPPNVAEYYNSFTGNCGTAWIGYDAIGDKQAVVTTGFSTSLASDIYYYYFYIGVTDSDGVGSKLYDGDAGIIGGTYWDSGTGWDTYHSVTGYSYDTISDGYALLDNGITCTAANISAYDYLY
jgi:hypothetical protein